MQVIKYPFTSKCWEELGHCLCGGSLLEVESERLNCAVANIMEYNIGSVEEEVFVVNQVHNKTARISLLKYRISESQKSKILRPEGLFAWARETHETMCNISSYNEVVPVNDATLVELYDSEMSKFQEESGIFVDECRDFFVTNLVRGGSAYQAMKKLLQHTLPICYCEGPNDLPSDIIFTASSPVPDVVVSGDGRVSSCSSAVDELLPTKRVVYPNLVAALALDARSRWGLRKRTEANEDMVSTHIRKQCKNFNLHISAVDTHVALAVVEYFVPNGIDIMARKMDLNERNSQRRYDYETIGMSWLQRWRYVSPPAGLSTVA